MSRECIVDEDTLRDLASSACQEALSFGVNEDVFMRLARTVELRARAAATQNDESQNVARIEWNGEGLPSVGSVCEYRVLGGPWYQCEIRYSFFDGEDHSFVLKCPHLEFEQVARVCPDGSEGSVDFRQVRTPEQIAEDEREKARDDALNTMAGEGWTDGETEEQWQFRLKIVSEMLDMGYRKP